MCAVCPSWLSFILYNPLRKAFTDRAKILEESGITPDSIVLEIGAGNGFLTEVLAGRAQKVIAVELQDGMVRKLEKRIERLRDRVEIVRADIATLALGDSVADVCLLYYSFHEVSNKEGAVTQISRAVRKGGILSIYEPAIEVTKRAMEKTVAAFEQKGFLREVISDRTFTRFARLRKKADT